jgi:glycosyltransferase involved in cell wall biosynthesis
MPAYNAEKTLERTVAEVPREVVDEIIVVDDHSSDRTEQRAKELGLACIRHPENRGYGGNQKTCYTEALRRGADIVVMVHPDYQYTPKLLPAMVAPIAYDLYHCTLAPRRDAVLQIRVQPVADALREPDRQLQAVGVSHRLPGLQPQAA